MTTRGVAMVCGFLMLGGGMAVAQAAAPAATAPVLSEARVYTVEEMPVRKMANGGESRDILRGCCLRGRRLRRMSRCRWWVRLRCSAQDRSLGGDYGDRRDALV